MPRGFVGVVALGFVSFLFELEWGRKVGGVRGVDCRHCYLYSF